jgi:hypothetical protein
MTSHMSFMYSSTKIYIREVILKYITQTGHDCSIMRPFHIFRAQKKRKMTKLRAHFFKKAFTVLRGETFGRTPWPGDQPDARPLPTQDNTTQKHSRTLSCRFKIDVSVTRPHSQRLSRFHSIFIAVVCYVLAVKLQVCKNELKC